jgi:hypothetical protein
MRKILDSKYRYPLFFLGIFIMELGGLFYKFVTQNVTDVEYFVIPGFLIFLISLATP